MEFLRLRVDHPPLPQHRVGHAAVALFRRHEEQAAMQMLAVVPGDEFQHPLPRQVDVLEAVRRVARRVLASAEPGFDMGVVVGDAEAAVRRRDSGKFRTRKGLAGAPGAMAAVSR